MKTPNPRGPRMYRALALLAACGVMACGEAVTAVGVGTRVPPPEFGPLTPLQTQLLQRPVSAEAAAGRPATPQDLLRLRDAFGPGELQALLVVANRRAAARGLDTLPHCVPLCGLPQDQGR